MRKLLRPSVLLAVLVTVIGGVTLAIRHGADAWFAILLGSGLILPALASQFSRMRDDDTPSDDQSKPE